MFCMKGSLNAAENRQVSGIYVCESQRQVSGSGICSDFDSVVADIQIVLHKMELS